MQFKVPQDVQREDTIVGPLTLKQMIILMFGGGFAYITFASLSRTYFIEIWIGPVVIIGAITLAFTFLKIHNMPFHIFVMNFIEYHLLGKKRIWIQGGGDPFMPPAMPKAKVKKAVIEKTTGKARNIEELTKIVDKKEGLKDMINQNYKK
jgi:hypothetical protein